MEEVFEFGVVAIVILLVLAVITSIALSLTGLHYNTGNGEHTGYATAIEKSGIIFKTDRVYFKTDTQSSQEDQYCIIDDNVYNQLQDKVAHKEHITVTYVSYLANGIANCGGEDAVVTGIK